MKKIGIKRDSHECPHCMRNITRRLTTFASKFKKEQTTYHKHLDEYIKNTHDQKKYGFVILQHLELIQQKAYKKKQSSTEVKARCSCCNHYFSFSINDKTGYITNIRERVRTKKTRVDKMAKLLNEYSATKAYVPSYLMGDSLSKANSN